MRKPPIALSEEALKELDRDYFSLDVRTLHISRDFPITLGIFQVGTADWQGSGDIPQARGDFTCYGLNFYDENDEQVFDFSGGPALIGFRRTGSNFLMSHLYSRQEDDRTSRGYDDADKFMSVKQDIADDMYDIAKTRGIVVDVSQIALAQELGFVRTVKK